MFPPEDGPRLGILMLETRFPRPVGDVGNPASWPVPVRLQVVPGLAPGVVVQSAAGLRAAGVLPAMREALRELQSAGCKALTTSCGFLVLLQRELQEGLQVPLVTSSLLQLPALLAQAQRVGVLTISARDLGEEHLLAAGVPRDRLGDVVVHGMPPETAFVRCILGNRPEMDLAQAEREVVQAAVDLATRAPDLRTLVLECTNLPPYAQAIRRATGLEVKALADVAELARALH